jgi:hypothetical protein
MYVLIENKYSLYQFQEERNKKYKDIKLTTPKKM